MSMVLDTVLQIDEVGMTFKAKFLLALRWRDWRVTFRDLKWINPLNDKEKSQIWIPYLVFENGQNEENGFSTRSGTSKNLFAMRDNLDAFQVMDSLDEGRLYYNQSLWYSAWFIKQFSCEFDLHHYPFDIQKCQIKLRVPKTLQISINLIPLGARMLGPNHISQFTISNISMKPFIPRVKLHSTKNHSASAGIMLQFHIHRDITHHIYMTYIPTLFILIMSLFSLFIGEEHFGATTAVSMTCMLVLYTLYQGIVANMPVTVYMKLLDIWLIFNLAIPFFVFVTLVSWELMKGKPTNQVMLMDYLHESEDLQQKKSYCKLTMQIILPGISAVFVLAYISFVIYVIQQ